MALDSYSANISGLIKVPLRTMGDEDAIDCVGALIDLSTEKFSESGIKRAFGMLKEIGRRSLIPSHEALLHYFCANAWMAKRIIAGETNSLEWEQPSRQEQILALLTARNHPGFDSLNDIRRCHILTNLGIQLNGVGRFVEAIERWDRALEILPNFAMANGSRGDGLSYYGRALEDRYDLEVLCLHAHKSYTAAITRGALWDSVYPPSYKEHFRSRAQWIQEALPLDAIEGDLDLVGPSLGRGKESVPTGAGASKTGSSSAPSTILVPTLPRRAIT